MMLNVSVKSPVLLMVYSLLPLVLKFDAGIISWAGLSVHVRSRWSVMLTMLLIPGFLAMSVALTRRLYIPTWFWLMVVS